MAKYINAELIKSIRVLYFDIDACITELIRARIEHNEENEGKALFRMEGLMVATMQQLDCIIDSLQQEQPSEDLEVRKQIEELANDWHHKGFASDEDCPLCMQDLMDILWHFYELGKQSKEPVSEELEEEINRWQGCEAFPEGINITPLPQAMEIVERTAKHFFKLGEKTVPSPGGYWEGFKHGVRECQDKIRDVKDTMKEQKEQMPMPEDTVIFQKGIEEGKRLMLEEAVEGYVNYYEDSGGILMAEAQVGCPYHNGDKVKIVIVKED